MVHILTLCFKELIQLCVLADIETWKRYVYVVLRSFLGDRISQFSLSVGRRKSLGLLIVGISGLPSAHAPTSSVSIHLIAFGRMLEVTD